jgi:tRNA A-37 threonylcarbamoyl transferase component Bud32
VADRVLGERYRVVRHLARGGMAEVYLAHDELLDRPVAVKLLFPELADDASFVERFRREARAAAGLNHPNIVSVYDFGEDDGAYFMVMEYVEGETLRDIIRSRGPLPSEEAAGISADVAAALAAAHRHGIVHRDVKPGNVLVSDMVKVADFGIARAGDPRESLTQTGAVLGTATYLAPEQAQGQPVDPRPDNYALGVMLYEMLAGQPPFRGDTPVAVAYQHLSETPVPPSQHNADVPPALDAVVLKAMEKDPARRQQSAQELRDELLAGRDGGAAAMAATAVVPPVDPSGAASTVVLPGPVAVDDQPERSAVGAVAPQDRDRRRQATAIGLLLLMVLAAIILIALLRSGESGTAGVPAVVGRTVAEAQRAVEVAGFRPAVTPRPDQPGDPNIVVDQTPPAGANARKGTTVTLFVPGAAPTTTRPPATTRAPTTTRPPATTAPAATAPPETAPPETTPPPTTPAPIVIPTSPVTSRRGPNPGGNPSGNQSGAPGGR